MPLSMDPLFITTTVEHFKRNESLYVAMRRNPVKMYYGLKLVNFPERIASVTLRSRIPMFYNLWEARSHPPPGMKAQLGIAAHRAATNYRFIMK
jgi:hypothetical protein